MVFLLFVVIRLGECGQLGVVANQMVLWPTGFCGQPEGVCCGQHSLPKLWAMVPAPWHANHRMATELGECVALVVWPNIMLIETSGLGKPQQVLKACWVQDQAPGCSGVSMPGSTRAHARLIFFVSL